MTENAESENAQHAGTARRVGLLALLVVAIALVVTTVIALRPVTYHSAGEVPLGVTPGPVATASPSTAASGAVGGPLALFVGDSYTAGTGAGSKAAAESCLTAAALGWTCVLDAQGGTGFLADGHNNQPYFAPLIGRVTADYVLHTPDIVVVDAGRNDDRFATSEVTAAAGRYLTRVHELWPRAKVVTIVPYFMSGNGSRTYRALASVYRSKNPRYVIDPTGEGWISAKTRNLTISDRVHPNPAGHRYIASHLAADLRRLGVS